MILNILKQYLSYDSRHKRIKSLLNCIHIFLNSSLNVSLVSFPKLKMKSLIKYLLFIVKLWYRLVPILSTHDYNSIRCSFRHSMSLELDERGKLIYFCLECLFHSVEYLTTWHSFEKST